MIAVLDTNALHSDVFVTGPTVQTFFAAADHGACEIWVPSVVVEELVRQFPINFRKLTKAEEKGRKVDEYLKRSFGPEPPRIADGEQPAAFYRARLSDGLNRGAIKLVGPPRRAGVIAEWVAQRRHPIPKNGAGTIDAQIWLTAIEAAKEDQCVLIANNPRDFADPDNHSELHPTLKGDLAEVGLDEDAVVICPTIRDFLQLHVEPDLEVAAQGEALLSDARRRELLRADIEEAIPWFNPDPRGEGWSEKFGDVDVDDASLVAFDIEFFNLVRADKSPVGDHLIVEAYGNASLDLGLFTYEAAVLPVDSPISIEELDFNESMSTASAEVGAALIVDVLLENGKHAVSVEEVEPIGNESVCALLQGWAESNPEACRDLIADSFDIPGQQRATAANPVEVEKFQFQDGALFARVEFSIDYANPVDEEDRYMSADNDAVDSFEVKLLAPDFERGEIGELMLAEGIFPD